MARAGIFQWKGSNALAEGDIQDGEAEPDEEIGADAVARYLADMTRQLESMARASKLELLAYLLAMARAEAESLTVEMRADSKMNRR